MPYDQSLRSDINKAVAKPKRGDRSRKNKKRKKVSASNQGGASVGGGT